MSSRDDTATDCAALAPDLGRYLAAALHDHWWTQCTVRLIAGGKSNITYLVSSPAGEVVVRRPPTGDLLPTAHDMGREFRVMTALDQTAVPVPRCYHHCADRTVLGAPFYVMERVVGHTIRDAPPPDYLRSDTERRDLALELVRVLARLHSLTPAEVGLEGFGRPEGFLNRQLVRWQQQSQLSEGACGAVDELHTRLARDVPERAASGVVHGDFRLDNVVLHPSRPDRILAVLDWEMSTLGDPLADLGMFLMYWPDPSDDERLRHGRGLSFPATGDGFPPRHDLLRAYGQLTGFDLGRIDWYFAFALFKFAVICQGIAARASAHGEGIEGMDERVDGLAQAGLRTLTSGSVLGNARP